VIHALGAVENKRLLSSPRRGAPSLLHDAQGRLVLGLWDIEQLIAPWEGLFQGQPLLTEGNEIKVIDKKARAALGISPGGQLLYAWSPQPNPKRLQTVMSALGVSFAFSFDSSGIRFGPPDEPFNEGLACLIAMGRQPAGEGSWSLKRGLPERWWQQGEAWVQLLAIDPQRWRLELIPGLAEPPPQGKTSPEEMSLPALPSICLPIGLRRSKSPYGFILRGQIWRPPQQGILSFRVERSGESSLNRPEGAKDLSLLLQGPILVEGGRSLVEAQPQRRSAPRAALGRAGGWLIYARSELGDLKHLAQALIEVGVEEALLLGERGAVDPLLLPERPEDLRPGAGSLLALIPRAPPPRLRLLSSFRLRE